MELKDVVLNRGDVVYFEDDTAILQFDWENNITIKEWNKITHSNKKIIKIERPRYETIYEAQKQILEKEEKEYLENVIRPFKEKVLYIGKCRYDKSETFIAITINTGEVCDLPLFENDKYYKNMEYKRYTLKELGLFEGE